MVVRWEPFGGIRRRRDPVSDVFDMQEQMNRLFSEFFGERQSGLADGVWTPPVDVSETESAIVVRAELPGMSRDDIELSLQDHVLTLKGEKAQESKEDNENFHRAECCFGSFSRSFSLSATVKQEDIQARFKDGILEITLPKAEETTPQKISIAAGA